MQRYIQAYNDNVISGIQLDDAKQAAEDGNKLYEQAQSEISQAESRLKEQQGSYEKTMRQTQFDSEQASSRLKEQQSGYDSLIEAGKLAVLKSEQQVNDLNIQIAELKTEIEQSQSQIESSKFELSQRVIFLRSGSAKPPCFNCESATTRLFQQASILSFVTKT